jgi:type I restriction enzyme M protein
MNLYSEALVKFSESKQLPELFRNIFKSAYLPYRSPDVLGLFLKEIDYFNYSHPEELGNAYEYLLSIMSSQGDAGQFRTPRHIIDFIVEAVNPTKDDKVLDPACGTGGFLISAYKNILKQHDGKDDPKKKEKPLTPDQRRTLMQNFEGYDIDPGMVRIAQVNMYLHQFKNPKIVQYDSLSMDERWNDKFDVILANPPFMSPKGGVSTHNKFGIQSTRSEVLFVDYIMNHLRPKGRAGIIVPEGIIFQSATAYKQLRKNLVNNGLYAVVSLPSGVFQPYSGVKTSILFFDNEIAKKDDDVLFIKINNDGFDLGAQRRPLKTSHLPAALEILHLYREHVLGGKKIVFKSDDEFALLVSKEKITKSDDYSLSGDRYRTNTDYENIKWPLIEIGELCELGRGRVISKRDIENDPGPYPVYSSQTTDNGIFGYINTFDFDGEYVTWTTDGANAGTVFHRNGKFNCTNVCGTLKAKTKDVDMRFLAKVLNNVAYKYVIQVGNPKLMNNVMAKIKIPVPPLEVQKEIVEQIEIKQRAIEGAREVIKNLERERRYFAHSLRGLKDIKWLKLGDVCETSSGGTPLKSKKEYYENGTVPWLKSGEVNQGYVYKTEEKITPIGLKNSSAKIFPVDTVLVAMYGATAGKVGLLKTEASTNQAVCGILPNDKIVPEFLYFYLRTRTDDMVRLSGGGAQPNISQAIIRNMEIPLIPIDTQKILIADVVREEEVINSNKKLIEIMENKISNVLVGL